MTADSLGGGNPHLYLRQGDSELSMLPLISFLLRTLFFLLFTCNALGSAGPCVGYDCLQEYAFREDEAYSWYDTGHRIRVDETGGRGGWTGYFLNFTSQQVVIRGASAPLL